MGFYGIRVCVGLFALPLPGAGVTFFAAAKKVSKESSFEQSSKCPHSRSIRAWIADPPRQRAVQRTGTATSSSGTALRAAAGYARKGYRWRTREMAMLRRRRASAPANLIDRPAREAQRRSLLGCTGLFDGAPARRVRDPRRHRPVRALATLLEKAAFFGYFLCSSKESDPAGEGQR